MTNGKIIDRVPGVAVALGLASVVGLHLRSAVFADRS